MKPESAHAASTREIPAKHPTLHFQTATSSAAPVFVIRDVTTEVGVGRHGATPVKSQTCDLSHDIIESGLIGSQEASSLLEL